MTDTMRPSAKEQAKEQVGGVASTAGDEVRAVAHDAASHARRATHDAREQLRSQAADRTATLASSLRDASGQLSAMARGEGPREGPVNDITRQLADTVDRAAARLDEGGLDGALEDLKRFARQRPGLFVIGAIGAGFAVGRLLKAADTHSIMDAAKSGDESTGFDNGSTLPASMPYAAGTPIIEGGR